MFNRPEYYKAWRLKNKEYIKIRNRLYALNNKEAVAARLVRYRKNNPIKISARRRLQDAVRDGRITRPDKCECCETNCIPHGHHDDYLEPFKVKWLCRTCHDKLHNY